MMSLYGDLETMKAIFNRASIKILKDIYSSQVNHPLHTQNRHKLQEFYDS